MRTWRSTIWWTAAVTLTVVVAFLSLGPQPEIDATEGVSDKALHAGFYAALAGTYLAAIRDRLIAVSLSVFTYGALLELLQTTLADRSAEALDLAANATGILATALLALAWRQATQRAVPRTPDASSAYLAHEP